MTSAKSNDSVQILDSRPPDLAAADPLDRLAKLAQGALGAKWALITLVSGNKQVIIGQAGPKGTVDTWRSTLALRVPCFEVVQTSAPVRIDDTRRHRHLRLSRPDFKGLVAYCGVPLYSGEGEIIGTLCVIDSSPRSWTDADVRVLEDLAEVIRGERELRSVVSDLDESRERYRGLVENLREVVLELDMRGRITYASPAWVQMTGFDAAQVVGRPLVSFLDSEDRLGMRAAREALTGSGEMRTASAPLLRADNTQIITEINVRLDAQARRMTCTMLDVTARRNAARYRDLHLSVVSILAANPLLADAISLLLPALVDPLGLQYGSCWQIDETKGELVCTHSWSAPRCPPLCLEGVRLKRDHFIFGAALDAQESVWFEDLLEAPNLQLRPVLEEVALRGAVFIPMTGNEGEVGVLALATLQTLRHEVELGEVLNAIGRQVGQFVEQGAAAEAADLMKDEFIDLVSHELRTPLASIMAYVETLEQLEAERMSARGKKFLHTIDNNTQRLMRLVGDLLVAGQIVSGEIVVARDVVDLVSIARHCVDDTRLGPSSILHIEADLPNEEVWVRGDAQRLGQVIDSLISNAIKFSPDGGRLDVAVRSQGGSAIIEVCDTGMGIDAGELENIFGRFYRTRAASEAAIQGVGLGLSIVKAIVEGHGGTVSASSAAGGGAIFTIRIPLCEPDESGI